MDNHPMTTASAPLPTRRADLLARLAQPHHYDLAVIGGGATFTTVNIMMFNFFKIS